MGNTKLKVRSDLAKKSNSATTIYLAYTYKEKTKFFSTGQKIELGFWDIKTSQVKKGYNEAKTINVIINSKKAEIEAIINEAHFKKIEPTFDYVQKQLDLIYKPESVKVVSKDFFVLYDEFIRESASVKSEKTASQYRITYNLLRNFQQAQKTELTLDGIDMNFYKKFVKYCEQTCHLAPNTIGNRIKNLKTFLKHLTDEGINVNLTFQQKNFKKPSSKTDIIYLTRKELHTLAETDLSKNPRLERVRDAFVFECVMGIRYSDIANLKSHNIKSDCIDFISVKTGDRLVIPLTPLAKQIIAKYDNDLPNILTNQKMNEYLKEIGLICGITEPVQIIKIKGGKRIEQVIPKYELLTTHVGRRTFITQALERGMRPEVIMRITGHKEMKTMMLYVKITDDVVKREMMKAWDETNPSNM